MAVEKQLFEGKLIRLGPIDHENDPEVESRWTYDHDYLHAISPDPARPLSAAKMKKKYEAIEKKIGESKNSFYFTIRFREDNRLLGFVHLEWIEWSHGAGFYKMGIGAAQDRGKGYGREALELLLNFAFNELNLYRLSAVLGEDNPAGLRFFQRSGFVEEVRRRQALQRDGRFWDAIHLGLLVEDWLRAQQEVGG